MTKAEVLRHLQGLAHKINQINPDILLLQEVDMDSTRSAYLNQVQWLLDHRQLNDAAFASDWRVKWVPSHGLGRMNSGNAVLSRWPLKEARRIALLQMEQQSPLRRFCHHAAERPRTAHRATGARATRNEGSSEMTAVRCSLPHAPAIFSACQSRPAQPSRRFGERSTHSIPGS